MLSYLNVEDDERSIVQYLTGEAPLYLPEPFNYCFPGELPEGKEFLRYCKFGTMQVIDDEIILNFANILYDTAVSTA